MFLCGYLIMKAPSQWQTVIMLFFCTFAASIFREWCIHSSDLYSSFLNYVVEIVVVELAGVCTRHSYNRKFCGATLSTTLIMSFTMALFINLTILSLCFFFSCTRFSSSPVISMQQCFQRISHWRIIILPHSFWAHLC